MNEMMGTVGACDERCSSCVLHPHSQQQQNHCAIFDGVLSQITYLTILIPDSAELIRVPSTTQVQKRLF